MSDTTLLKTGVAGTALAAICCATPVLVLLLGALGLSAWVGWIDTIVLPALVLFLGLTGFALWRRWQAAACCDTARQTNTRS